MAERSRCSGCRNVTGLDTSLAMAFQPIVDTASGSVFAYEALIRGADGTGAAHVLSQVTAANRYWFDQACRVIAIESALVAGLLDTDARLSINFLPDAVYSPVACIQATLKAAHAAGMPIDRLIFEFTEQEEMTSPEQIAAIIACYKQIGFSVALDDFGAGYSGLAIFARFVPDEVKLDIELVRGVDADPRRRTIVRAVAAMCAELGTLLIAEGVETAAEAETLRALGVRYHQGFWYARPELGRLPALNRESLAA